MADFTAVGDDGPEGLLGTVADEFTDRLGRGESPSVEEYARRHPEIAGLIREIFPALKMLHESDELEGEPDLLAESAERKSLGDFRLIREIGRGGMGIVYEAEQLSLGRRVAVKVLPFASVLDPRQLQRFKNEALAAAQLDHPNIVDVYGVGCDRGVHYYAMRHVEGSTLAQVVAERRCIEGSGLQDGPAANAAKSAAGPRRAPFGGEEAALQPTSLLAHLSTEVSSHSPEYIRSIVCVGIQIADALEHAHNLGITHRDIKPTNLLLDSRGNAWIADFGLAQVGTDTNLTLTGDVLGTLRYMSPEQALGERRQIDHRTDVYSLGVTLYELLTLRPAFSESERRRLLHDVVHREPPAPRDLNRFLPRDLETILLKAINKDVNERYATAQELADDLRRFLADRPIEARRPRLIERAAKWSRRHIHLAWATVLVLVVLLMASTTATVLVLREQGRTAAARDQAGQALQEARRQRELAEQRQRAAQMLSMQLALDRGLTLCEAGEIAQGMLWLARALEAAPPGADDLRHVVRANLAGWSSQLASLQQAYALPGAAPFAAVGFDQDRRLFAAADDLGTIRVWRLADEQLIGRPLQHHSDVSNVFFGPDAETVLAGLADGSAYHWRIEDGGLLNDRFPDGRPLSAGAVSPDGKTAFVQYRDQSYRFWDVEKGKPLTSSARKADWFLDVQFNSSGTTAAGVVRKGPVLLDVQTGQVKSGPFQNQDYFDARLEVHVAAVNAEGTKLLVGNQAVALVRDARSGEVLGEPLQHRSTISAAAFGPQGRYLLTGSRNRVAQLWQADTHRPAGQPLVHRGEVLSVAFRSDAPEFFTVDARGMVRRWQVPPGDFGPPAFRHPSLVDRVAFAPSGHRLVTLCGPRGQQELRLWDVAAGRLLHRDASSDFIRTLAISLDGRRLAAGGGSVLQLWSVGDRLSNHKRVELPLPELKALAFSPDGSLLVAARKNAIFAYHTDTLLPAAPPLAHQDVILLAFSPDGRTLLSGSASRPVRLWDLEVASLKTELQIDPEQFATAAFAPDSRQLLVGCAQGKILLFDAVTGEPAGELLRARPEASGLAFAPDGRTVLSIGEDATARFYDLPTGRVLGPLRPYHSAMGAAAFRGDSRLVTTVFEDGSVKLIDVPQPVPNDPERITLWVETATGMELDDQGDPVLLDADAWNERRRRLEQLGGPPELGPANRQRYVKRASTGD